MMLKMMILCRNSGCRHLATRPSVICRQQGLILNLRLVLEDLTTFVLGGSPHCQSGANPSGRTQMTTFTRHTFWKTIPVSDKVHLDFQETHRTLPLRKHHLQSRRRALLQLLVMTEREIRYTVAYQQLRCCCKNDSINRSPTE